MHKEVRFQVVFVWMRHPAFLLFLFGGVGLICGTSFAVLADTSIFPLMRQAINSRLSIVCHIASQLLPFLIAAYAANISQSWLLYTVCGIKLFLFAYIGTLIWIAFGTAGWLIRMLFLFSDIILTPLLCWFCFRRTLSQETAQRKDLWLCMGIAGAAALVNCLFISPFLARIINI